MVKEIYWSFISIILNIQIVKFNLPNNYKTFTLVIMKFTVFAVSFWLAINSALACMDINNPLNTNFKLWDIGKGKGLSLGAVERFTHDTLGGFDQQKLVVTTDYDSAMEVLIDDDYHMITASDPNKFIDLFHNQASLKFDSGDIPDYIDNVNTRVETKDDNIIYI